MSQPTLAQQEVIIKKQTERIEYDDDIAANNKEYFGWALKGTLTSVARWKIMRITYTGTDYIIEWANAGAYTAEWDNRAIEVYS